MNRKTTTFIIIGVLLVILYGFGVWTVFDNTEIIQLSGGEPEASIPQVSGTVYLIRGEWLTAWSPDGLSVVPGDNSGLPRISKGFSGIWNASRSGILSPATGSAVYRAHIRTEGRRGLQSLYVPSLHSASRIYVNGKEILKRGIVGNTYDSEKAESFPGIAVFEQDSDDVEILVQVSNFHSYNGGSFYFGLEYGTFEDITRMTSILRYLLLTVFFLVFGFTFYCGIRSLNHKSDRYHFFLALGFAVLLGRVFLGDIVFFPMADVIKNLPYRIGDRLEIILTFLAVPIFINFGFRYLEGVGESKRASVAALIMSLAGGAAAIAIPGRFFNYLAPVEYVFIIIGLGFYLILGIIGSRKKISLSLLFICGAVILFVSAVYAFLFFLGLFSSAAILWAVIFVSIITAGIVLSFRERQFLNMTVKLRNRLIEVTDSRDSILLSLSDESLDKVNELTKTLIQGSLGPLNSDQLVTTSLVLSNSMRHQNILNDTIDLVRLGENTLMIRKDSVNLFSIASLYIGSIQPVILGLSVDLTNDIPRDLPQVWADEKRLGQILYTFFSFATQNTEKGGIKITALQEHDKIKVSVTVQGVSSGEKIEKVAEVLRLEERISSFDGHSLEGLRFFLARELVRLHNGELTMERPEKDDVVFSFTLPVYMKIESPDEVLPEELAIHLDALHNLQPLLEEVESERDITILAAAGDAGNLQVIKSQLASMNYHIHPVLSGEALLQSIMDERPDLVVIDSSLTDYSCFEITRALRNEFTIDELPVIQIIEDTYDVMESLTSGASDYLRKPYQPEEFLTRVNTHLQLSKINSVYNQFVPREFLKALGQDNIIDLKLGDQVQREMTILFVDIRAFTNLSENMTPQENFKFINSYLSQFTPIITRNNGFVDKFIGDAIMALYPDSPEDAIRTAIEMTEYVKIYNGYRANCGYNPINIGIGIHTGNMILGIVGDSRRMQGTVISDAVNLASRIQDVTKLYKSNVVISQETFIKLENPTEFFFRFLGKVKVKGKDKSVSLFEIYNADDEEIKKLKEETKGEFETAILLFAKRDFLEAAELFEKVLAVHPDDKTAMLFLDRANKFLASEKKSFLTSL